MERKKVVSSQFVLVSTTRREQGCIAICQKTCICWVYFSETQWKPGLRSILLLSMFNSLADFICSKRKPKKEHYISDTKNLIVFLSNTEDSELKCSRWKMKLNFVFTVLLARIVTKLFFFTAVSTIFIPNTALFWNHLPSPGIAVPSIVSKRVEQ